MRALILSVLLCLTAPLARAETLLVFAAASTKTALEALADDWHAMSGTDVAFSFAGSSALARQVQQGAPADVLLTASADWMDVLQADGLLVPGTRADLLGNTLVLIAHGAAAPMALADLPEALGEDRLAMALVDAVPAGQYGKAALISLGLWETLAPRVAQTDNVRAALALVATGEAPFGIVYASDARAEPSVSVVASFDPGTHPPITYPVAAIAGGQEALAARFLTFLRGEPARAAFAAQGFTLK